MNKNYLSIGLILIVVLAVIFMFRSSDNEEEKSIPEQAQEDGHDQGMMGAVKGDSVVETDYVVDTNQSIIKWFAKKRVGAEHIGNVSFESGSIQYEDGLKGGSFVVDMTSITNTDLEEGPMKTKLERHLASDDFFSVESYPTSSMEIKEVQIANDIYMANADLTIKGITEEVDFPVVVSESDGQITLDAEVIFDRSLYDVRFGSGKFFENLGDNLIEDEVLLKVSIVASK